MIDTRAAFLLIHACIGALLMMPLPMLPERNQLRHTFSSLDKKVNVFVEPAPLLRLSSVFMLICSVTKADQHPTSRPCV